jgi:hypothetical protein
MKDNTESLSHDEKIMIFACGTIDELVRDGVLVGDPLLTGKGVSLFSQLLASDFEPTEEELSSAVQTLLAAGSATH